MSEPIPAAPGRVIDLSVEVPGSVEEVWAAVATGPGITAWFIPVTVEERTGGTVTMDFGSFSTQTAAVAAWEPPHRVVFTGGEGERVLAYEWTVEARAGGTCVVRLVNSGFGPGDDWDGDFEGMSRGWRLFLENLRLHATYFRGRPATSITPQGFAPGPHAAAWQALTSAVGVPADLAAGSPFETSGDGVPVLRGRVDTVLRTGSLTACLVVLDEPEGSGVLAAEGDGDGVMASFYQYRYGDAASLPDDWSPLFAARFPVPDAAAAPAGG